LSTIIVEESGRLNDIVTDFLDFAKPQAPKFQSCNLEEIIDRNISFLKPELDKKKVVVHNGNLNSQSLSIEADPELLYRAFLNIFLNAVQAMTDGGSISIKAEEIKDSYRVGIRDTGIGISKENLKKIFSPFFTTKDKGSGLGLSIVKKIIEGHNGTISIDSEEGIGTKVSVSLLRENKSQD
jgi:signal transduction histidine kinase